MTTHPILGQVAPVESLGRATLEAMDRYAQADALDGLPGFDRTRFFIADAARSYVRLIPSYQGWKPETVPKLRAEAARRYARLREMRKECTP